MCDLSRGEVSPAYLAWYRKKNTTRAKPERPTKKPHIQEFVEVSQEQWAWLAKENEYRATIGKLEKQVRDLQFENGLQAAADEGKKKKLAKENDALRAQIQEMKIVAENPARSAKDEKFICNLRQKVGEYGFDLKKAEGELARAQTKLAKNAEERARLVQQLKEKYDNGVMRLKKKIIVLENKMTKQAKDFKAEREHCYVHHRYTQLRPHHRTYTQPPYNPPNTTSHQHSLIFLSTMPKHILNLLPTHNGVPQPHKTPTQLHKMLTHLHECTETLPAQVSDLI